MSNPRQRRQALALAIATAQAQVFSAPDRTRLTHPPSYSALPTDVKNKPWLAVKVAAFSVVGFGTPFFMAWYQMYVAGDRDRDRVSEGG